jgi:hopanoid biosynthesis associated RND transporter like protein HpnN
MTRLIVAIVNFCHRRAAPVLVFYALLIALGLNFTAHHLTIDTDTDHLFAASLPWRQQQMRLDRAFPQFDNLIVAVIRAPTPEAETSTARALAREVARDRTHFIDVSRPSSGAFYRQNGLLLLPQAKLADLLNTIVIAEPFLGQLSADPSAAGLFKALGLIAQGVSSGQAHLGPYEGSITSFASALQRSLAASPNDPPPPLSWQTLIAPHLSDAQGGVQFVLIHPVLDHHTLEPGGAATAALRRMIATLPLVRAGQATVHYTGQIPLSDEQFASLRQGVFIGLAVSLALIALWLTLAVRSWRMIVPILVTLVAGLALTISFAAVAIGRLNLISVAFAILFVGLAVDFAIQFCVRLRDARQRITDPGRSMNEAAREAGGQIALAAIATACGFLAFVPTSFIGVAELGGIAGVGMLIAFICTISLLPALLSLTRPRAEAEPIGFAAGARADRFLIRHRRMILSGFAVLALGGAVSAARLQFDANPLDTQNPNSEAMRTLRSLTGNIVTNPFYIETLAPSLADARRLTAKLSALPDVAAVISGADFIPTHQSAKRAMISQTQAILAPALATGTPPAVTPARIRAAAAAARQAIAQAAPKLPAGSPMRSIGAALARFPTLPDAQIITVNHVLTGNLPGELDRLNQALNPARITAANLPASIKRDWFLPNGRVRLQIIPTAAAGASPGIGRFVRAVQRIVPNAGGPAVISVATAETILGAFREAALLASVSIALILIVVLRSARDAALVIVTLALSALLTALFARLDGLALNYANIIALPLLLGVGVSFNVYFVMNWRAGMHSMLGSATARAVLFSALTTGTAFGSLAASADRGTASMGTVLLLSLLAVLIATFVFLPALLATLTRKS